MIRSRWMIIPGLILALVVTARVEEGRIAIERSRVQALALRASNVAAERDSTRNVATTSSRVAALLGDSLRIAERRVLQVTQKNDALDEALARERRARYQVVASVDSLHDVITGAAFADHTSERHANFGLRQPPYTIQARVSMPAPPDSARLEVGVALDPVALDLRLGCAAPDQDGVRAASVDVTTPVWASVRLDRVEQSRELCTAPAHPASAGSGTRRFAFTPLAAGMGRLLSADGRWRWGLFVGAGVRAW